MSSKYVRFSKAEFEAALPKHRETGAELWRAVGLVDGERQYVIPVYDGCDETNKVIFVRSSVGRSGFSGGCGSNSIRVWVMYHYRGAWRPLGKESLTQRTVGWQLRMVNKIRKAYRKALADEQARKRYRAA